MGGVLVCAGLVAGGIAVTNAGSNTPPKAATTAAPPSSVSAGRAPLRLLIMGDSEADTLGVGIQLGNPPVTNERGAGVFGGGQIACGVVLGAETIQHGQVRPMAPACNVNTPVAERWPALVRADIEQDHPNVVLVVAGRIEVLDRRATDSGPWQNILQPGDAKDVEQQLDLAAQMGIAAHAHVELATAPCYSSGKQPDGDAWSEDDPARVRAYNALVRDVAAAHPGQVSVVDLDAVVCPGGTFQNAIDGVTVRAPDGVHYPFYSIDSPNVADPDTEGLVAAFGRWIGPRVMPEIAAGAPSS